jgi:D-xylose transport system substrate-binding protein
MKRHIFVIAVILSGLSLWAQKEPAPKQQWEYLVISPGKVYFTAISGSSPEVGPKLFRYGYGDPLLSFVSEATEIESIFDKLGGAGWELSGIVGDIDGYQQYVFKRALDTALVAAENKKAKAAIDKAKLDAAAEAKKQAAIIEKNKLLKKIGLSFSDFASERWVRERDDMSALLRAAGYNVLVQEANHDAALQGDQIKNMAAQGANVIIAVAEDGDALAATVDEVAKKGVKIIAYDRLIRSANIAAYVSFDAVEIGRNQAKGILAARNSGNFVLLGGSPADYSSFLFRAGQMEVLQPLIDAGTIKIVADQWVENWDPANAKRTMESILAATRNSIDAVVASNDGTALGALEAMRGYGLAGVVPISGQDATEAGCNSIAHGELTVTILKDIRKLAPLACDMAIKLANNEKITGLDNARLSDLSGDYSLTGSVPCKFLEVSQITRDNLKRLIVDSGFQTYEGVYWDVKDAPPK